MRVCIHTGRRDEANSNFSQCTLKVPSSSSFRLVPVLPGFRARELC